MGVCGLGVSEDGVRQPNESNHVAVQGQYFHCAVISEAAVCPRLGEDDVNLVLLSTKKKRRGKEHIKIYSFIEKLLKCFVLATENTRYLPITILCV